MNDPSNPAFGSPEQAFHRGIGIGFILGAFFGAMVLLVILGLGLHVIGP